jgi:lipopolysaccharide export system ATP-binding protein
VVDKAYIIDHGKVIGAGSPPEIIRNEIIRKLYLGNTFAGKEFNDNKYEGSAFRENQAPLT